MTRGEEERVKYLVTLLNTCAAACFTIGVAGPIAAVLYGATPKVTPWIFVLEAVGWLSVASSLHLSVSRILGRLG